MVRVLSAVYICDRPGEIGAETGGDVYVYTRDSPRWVRAKRGEKVTGRRS